MGISLGLLIQSLQVHFDYLNFNMAPRTWCCFWPLLASLTEISIDVALLFCLVTDTHSLQGLWSVGLWYGQLCYSPGFWGHVPIWGINRHFESWPGQSCYSLGFWGYVPIWNILSHDQSCYSFGFWGYVPIWNSLSHDLASHATHLVTTFLRLGA